MIWRQLSDNNLVPHRRWEFTADGVSLAIDLRSERRVLAVGRSRALAEEEVSTVAERLVPVLTGYRSASGTSKATLEVRLNQGAVLLRHHPGTQRLDNVASHERRSGWVGFERKTPITDPLYVPFAVDQWISDASLAVAPAGAVRLHAAGFEVDDETWVVVGDSGAGKSTVALRAMAVGATYLSDERMTVHCDGRVTGLRRPVRSRDTHETVRRLVGEHQPIGRDAFRTLVHAPVADDQPRRCSRLVILSDDVGPGLTRPAVVRSLARSSQDLIREGPNGLVRLCELVAGASVWVRSPRSLDDLRELGPPSIGPLDEPGTVAELRIAPGHGPPGWEVMTGAIAVLMGEEAVVWVPGPPPSVIGLNSAATDAWRTWARQVTGLSKDDDFHEALAACGVLRRAPAPAEGHRTAGSTNSS